MTRTVPQLAKYYGVAPKKIRELVEAGELQAIDLASPSSTRPRLAITEASVEAFEARRAVGPKPKPARRRKTTASVKDYFAHLK